MTFYAGMDWTGTPDRNSSIPLYGPCVIVIKSPEDLRTAFKELRQQFGMKAYEEFRGSKSSGARLAAVLNVGIDLDFRVGILLIDKPNSLFIPSEKSDFVMLSTEKLLRQFLPLHPIQRLWCDDEDLGKARASRFKKTIANLGRECGIARLRTNICPSHHNNLIQLADVTAYAFSWNARKRSDPEVSKALQKICNVQRNIIFGPKEWEG